MRLCPIEGCGKPEKSRRMCSMHYRRWQRTGDPGPSMMFTHPRQGVCREPGCLNPVDRSQTCSLHYYRRLKGREGWRRPAHLMSGVEIAWLAGLFEGEGCIHVSRRGTRLSINMTDQDVILRCRDVTNSGTVRFRAPNQEGWKPQWVWQVGHRRDVARLLLAMAPLLGERRRARALEAAERIAAMPYKS